MLAAEAQERANECLKLLEAGGPNVEEYRRRRRVHEEAAMLHRRLADVYDREDDW